MVDEMPPTISLVAPCLNEQDNVIPLASRFLERAKVLGVRSEIVFVDDGSTDNTVGNIALLQHEWRESVQLISHAKNEGIPAAWRSGVVAARGSLVCLIDADLQNRPESVFDLLDAYDEQEAGIVQGVRIQTNRKLSRFLMSKALNLVLNLTFRMKSSDNKSGFILCRTSDLRRILNYKGSYRHFQTFIGVAAVHHGLKIIEVKTPFDDRRSGQSFLTGRSWKVSLEVLRDFRVARAEFSKR
jgi:phenylacetate-CoA ligase